MTYGAREALPSHRWVLGLVGSLMKQLEILLGLRYPRDPSLCRGSELGSELLSRGLPDKYPGGNSSHPANLSFSILLGVSEPLKFFCN